MNNLTNKIFWKSHNNNTLKVWQERIEEISGTTTFCALPWIHVATRPNGDARLCCGSNASQATKGDLTAGLVKKENGEPANFGTDTLMSAFNNEYMKDVRTTMLEGKIPLSCAKCFEEESNGVTSKRVWETYYWDQEGLDLKEIIESTAQDGTIPPVIRYLDLRLGHTCNLKCIMCTPHDSSRWTQDHDQLINKTRAPIVLQQIQWDKTKFNNTWYERPELWEEIFEQIPNIQQLYFAGGEPLMIKEHRRFLEEIVLRGYSKNITVRYNSNGVLVDDKMIELWSNFKEVRFAFSIDALMERNHYIRYPVSWDETVAALHKLDNTPDNIKIGIACAIQIFNVKHIVEFAKWKIQQGFKKINKFKIDRYEAGGGILNMHFLYLPTYLSARILPEKDKDELVQQFSEFKQWLWDNYTQHDDFWKHNPNGWRRWEAVLKFVLAEDHTHLIPAFTEYADNMDDIRGTDWRAIFPELTGISND
jgi:sulfatase maturation enzyme AslB (radical SAM superfamily)